LAMAGPAAGPRHREWLAWRCR